MEALGNASGADWVMAKNTSNYEAVIWLRRHKEMVFDQYIFIDGAS